MKRDLTLIGCGVVIGLILFYNYVQTKRIEFLEGRVNQIIIALTQRPQVSQPPTPTP